MSSYRVRQGPASVLFLRSKMSLSNEHAQGAYLTGLDARSHQSQIAFWRQTLLWMVVTHMLRLWSRNRRSWEIHCELIIDCTGMCASLSWLQKTINYFYYHIHGYSTDWICNNLQHLKSVCTFGCLLLSLNWQYVPIYYGTRVVLFAVQRGSNKTLK